MKKILFFLLLSFSSINGIENIYINSEEFDPFSLTQKEREKVTEYVEAFSNIELDKDTKNIYSPLFVNEEIPPLVYHIKAINQDNRQITLQDNSIWQIGWLYRNDYEDWEKGDRLKVYKGSGINDIKIENLDRLNHVWGVLEKHPSPEHIDYVVHMTLRNLISGKGWILEGNVKNVMKSWKSKEPLFIFHDDDGRYAAYNLERNQKLGDLRFIANGKVGLGAELDKHVVGQQEATQVVSTLILNSLIGLKNPESPLASFLFLGPTGVGKTELAKRISDLLYGNQDSLIRFDMNLFSEPHSVAKLIGSPPGYVNHEEGGQLTNALREKPYSVVLLDELEKAHPEVIKIFLPILEEGYVFDNKGKKIRCNQAVFVMTSNLSALEIASLYQQNMTHDEVLAAIEPLVMTVLSPELYNRTQPVVFRPLTLEVIYQLVDQFLSETFARIQKMNQMIVMVDQNVKNYLAINGYHPALGARPLKRLIEIKIVGTLSYAIVSQGIPDGSLVFISYAEEEDAWHVTWK